MSNGQRNPVPPSVADVERITALADPVIRNLHITQCYHELSAVLSARTGQSANWCTFATWASKQAGQTIRREDLVRALEDRLARAPEITAALAAVTGCARALRRGALVSPASILQALDPAAAFDRAGEAVARGNRKVFEEIGLQFARF